MSSIELNTREQTEVRMTVLLGIIQQLMTTRQNRLFAGLGLSLSQFALLNHFTHEPDRSWTVTELAEVMEMNQPGITKVVTHLIDKGLLTSSPDETDGGKRYLNISKKGLTLCNETLKSLLPDISQVFSEWNESSLKQFHGQLEKLMFWLDTNRLDH